MIRNNICIFSESVDTKTIMLNTILEKYIPSNSNSNTNISKSILNSTKKYISFIEKDNTVNIFNTNDDFETNIKIMDQCNNIYFLLDCNNIKNDNLEKYYYVAYTLGIININFIIFNLENYPTNDLTIRLKDCEKYLKKLTKKIGIKSINITPYNLDIEIILLDNNCLFNSKNNSMIITNKINYNNNYDIINGTIRSGIIKKNDVLCVKPNNIIINVKKMEINHHEVNEVKQYDIIGMLVDKSDKIEVGNILVNYNSDIKQTNKLVCKIIVIENNISINDTLIMHYNHNKIECNITCIYKNLRLNISNKDSLPEKINKCKIGIICIDLTEYIFINKYDFDTKDGRILFTNLNGDLSCIGIIKVIK
jgi:hypothetical protein